jgi:hypothetical protein
MHTLWNEDETVVILDDELGLEYGANASLIAAAPDLLAALEGTVQVFEGLDRAAELHETLYPVLANCRVAIAAAKGET